MAPRTVAERPAPPASGPQPTNPPIEQELGVTINLPFGSFSDEVTNPEELDLPDLLDRLDKMMRVDGHARALYRLLTLPLRSASFDIKADSEDGEEGSEQGQKEAQFIKAMFTEPPHTGGMTTSWDYVRSLFGKALVNGFQVFEEVYRLQDMTKHGGPNPAIVLHKLAPREASTIRFLVDKEGGFNGVRQRAYGIEGWKEVDIPQWKAFFFTVDKEDHPFYGRSMFLPCLYHSDQKRKLYYIAHIAAQFNAVPGRLGYLDTADATPGQKNQFRQALADFGFNTAMLVPNGMRVEEFGNSGNGAAGLLELIQHHNVQASQSVLGQFIDLSVSTSNGSRSLSEDFSGIFLLCMETLLKSIAEHVNWYLIPKFIDWNFGTARYPKLVFEPLSDESRAAIVEIFTNLAKTPTSGASVEFMHELEHSLAVKLGLPLDYEDVTGPVKVPDPPPPPVPPTLPGAPAIGGPKPPGAPPAGPKPVQKTSEHVDVIELADIVTKVATFSQIGEIGFGAGSPGFENLGDLVREIQGRLLAWGIDLGKDKGTGVYLDATRKAVKEFQEFYVGVEATGTVDLATYSSLLEGPPSYVTSLA